MSRLNDLIRRVATTNEALAADLQREVSALADRRSFGLNFERHVPEAVELPGRPVRKGDKVRCLPPRGETPKRENDRLFRVTRTYVDDGDKWADIEALDDPDEVMSVVVDDLVVVAEFRDPIYPGLVSTGKVERGGDKPYHTVINAENYHALQTLLFTHRGKVDCIYIDPPYNTGAKDWKYNNDYVEGDDIYRHSKWLAFMERRLMLAKELLKPDSSVLIVTIDEKEFLRLGLLLEQIFPGERIQMISTAINPKGVARGSEFYRVDEYAFFVFVGRASVSPIFAAGLCVGDPDQSQEPPQVRWGALLRSGTNARRTDRPNLYYPIYIDVQDRKVVGVGSSVPLGTTDVSDPPSGAVAVWPRRSDGSDGNWQVSGTRLMDLTNMGGVKVSSLDPIAGRAVLMYLTTGILAQIKSGQITCIGRDSNNIMLLEFAAGNSRSFRPKSQWNAKSHSASEYGTSLVKNLLPGRKFPFPKSVYAVEDSIRFFVADNPTAVVLDFFAGSGTTAHATMRLNRQDGGRRQSISITNNEVSADEQAALREQGFRPGESEWEENGICDYITKPRLQAAVTGLTPAGDPIQGNYKFTDEFPMADGFEENVEFFTLTYEAPLRVASNRDFTRIAPLLWLRAGAVGRRIDDLSEGWDVADSYGVIEDLDQADAFLEAIAASASVRASFIVTNDDRLFESIARALPEHVEPVRLYESYLRNFEIESGRSTR